MSHAQQLHHRRSLDDSRQIINRRGLPSTVQGDVCQQGQAGESRIEVQGRRHRATTRQQQRVCRAPYAEPYAGLA